MKHWMDTAEYKEKPLEYYKHVRREIADEIPVGPNMVLEIGCAEGLTGAALKAEGRAGWIAGIELMEDAADQAGKVLDQVLIGNIENMVLPFSEGQFDAIICADVLEHLVDPWSVLCRLRLYLKPNGRMVVSLPNVRNWRVLMPLLFLGRWEYQEEGILDRTHLRFFTRTDGINLLRRGGFEIMKIAPTGQRSNKFRKLGMNFLSELTAVQYVFVGERT